jgi:chromate transporter
MSDHSEVPDEGHIRRLAIVFLVALRLGVTSFGGPVAHLGYFRSEYVVRRRWLDEKAFADLIALCQLLPGPASSQLGIAVGMLRAGPLGGFLAWLGFTLPSAIALIVFAYGVSAIGDVAGSAWLHGLKIAVVAVVALAVWSMAKSLAPDRQRASLAIAAAVAMLFATGAAWQIAVIAGGGALGWIFLRDGAAVADTGDGYGASRRGRAFAIGALALFSLLLIGLSIAAGAFDNRPADVFASFYRSGSLVFGGGHVVLPLLQAETAGPGWVSADEFVAGYGAAQAVPGPLFTFSAFLGSSIDGLMPYRWLGGLFALGAIFLPSFLLVWGALPFWGALRTSRPVRSAMMGVNAAVVGLLLAALYNPVWTNAITAPEDFALALALFVLLAFWKLPPWIVVGLAALGGIAIEAV